MEIQNHVTFGMNVKFRAKAGKGEELAAILLKASELISNAPGIHLYIMCRDASDKDIIWVMEVWSNKQDHDNSLNIEGVRELISQATPLIEGRPEGSTLDILGGKGM